MQLEFALRWVFGAGPGVWSLFIFVWIASTLGHLAFNHLRKEEKLLNTFKYAAFACAYTVLATGAEIANKENSRAALPLIFHLWGAFIWIVSDWTSLAIYSAATHKRGSRGWLADGVLGLRSWGDRIRKRIWKGRRWPVAVMTLVIVAVLFSSCSYQPPTWTPSAPQATAIELNKTYQAQATQMSPIGDTATPTSSITEVTETPTGPVEVGTPFNRPPLPGDFTIQQGTFSPYWDWNVRECPGCRVVGGLLAYHTYPIQGVTIEADGSTWLCQLAVRDLRGAEYCGPAMLYRKPGGEPSGVLVWGEDE